MAKDPSRGARRRAAHVVRPATFLLVATGALAGGIDQSGQRVTLIFEDGDYAELGLGYVMPTIEGVDSAGNRSGDVFGDITDFAVGVRKQLTERWSAGVIVDRPWGVDVNYDLDYPDVDFPYAGTRAEPRSLGVTGLLRYELDNGFSLHGGLRAERFGGEVRLAGTAFALVGLDGYRWSGDDDWGLGYVVGAAYEIPDIALRVALTYGSEIEHELDAQENFFGPSTTRVTMPQSVNLDFQTGVAPKTLLFGSVRWVNWAGWNVAPAGFTAATGAPLVEFENDAFTYRLGLGRQLTDSFAAAVEITHETARGQMMSPLDPYDGYTAIGLGGTWTAGNGLSVTGGVAYSFLGDAEIEVMGAEPASFEDNRSVALALKVGYRF